MRHIDPPEELVFTLGEHHSPVATIEPEDRVTIRALDSYANKTTSERDRVSERCPPPYVNPVTGPVLVDGAEPGVRFSCTSGTSSRTGTLRSRRWCRISVG